MTGRAPPTGPVSIIAACSEDCDTDRSADTLRPCKKIFKNTAACQTRHVGEMCHSNCKFCREFVTIKLLVTLTKVWFLLRKQVDLPLEEVVKLERSSKGGRQRGDLHSSTVNCAKNQSTRYILFLFNFIFTIILRFSGASADQKEKGNGGKAPRGGGRSRQPRDAPYARAPRQEYIPRSNPFEVELLHKYRKVLWADVLAFQGWRWRWRWRILHARRPNQRS